MFKSKWDIIYNKMYKKIYIYIILVFVEKKWGIVTIWVNKNCCNLPKKILYKIETFLNNKMYYNVDIIQ